MSFVIFKNHQIPTVLATTLAQQEQGLMYLKELPPSMSFVYASPRLNKFWMKNTYHKLDIVFCKNNRIIAIEQGEPLSTKVIGPDAYSDLVVELPASTCEKLGIGVGDTVRIDDQSTSF